MVHKKSVLPAILISLSSVGLYAISVPANADPYQQNFCSQTTQAALKACRAGNMDDYWIAMGNCSNLMDENARSSCKTETKQLSREVQTECKQQSEARADICAVIGEAAYDPQIAPANFVDPLQIGSSVAANAYFPLVPGNKWTYEGGGETNIVTVTEETKEIQGVKCIVVIDTVTEDGDLVEDTESWYAQDISGRVWFFGEISKSFEDGELTEIESFWEAGVDSAKAGVLQQAAPQVGDMYRQEFVLGETEEVTEVISLNATASVPAVSCVEECLMTREFTALEPGIEHRYYAPGIGFILEIHPDTGERFELIEMITR